MSVLFLDIDGVLNQGHHPDLGFNWVWLPAVAACNRIIAETNASVVVSSSWRLSHSLPEIAAILARGGLVANFVGMTPVLEPIEGEPCARIMEIRAWLDAHPEVTRFVVLDDQDIRMNWNDVLTHDTEIEARWVRTNYREGLTEDQADRAIRVLLGRD